MKKTHKIDAGEINRGWEYSENPRLEGLIKMLKSAPLKYINVSDECEFKKLSK